MEAQSATYISAVLDLVLSTTRLASYYLTVGRLQDAERQQQDAQRDYDALLLDRAAFDLDRHADDALRQKRADVERCLKALADGQTRWRAADRKRA